MKCGTPHGNEIRASEENLWFFGVWALTSLNISWKFRKSTFCKNWCSFATVTLTNSMSNKFSEIPRRNTKHQHTSKLKLTDGYRKRLSGSRTINQNVPKMPDFQTTNRWPWWPTETINLLGRKETVSTSHMIKWNVGRRTAMKFAPAKKICDF